MRLARLRFEGEEFLARLDGGQATPIARCRNGTEPLVELAQTIDIADAGALATVAPVAEPFPRSDAQVLAPVRHPPKIIAVGLNYVDHARETGADIPTAPLLFSKFASSIIGADASIEYRTEDSEQVDYEAELAVVIGRQGRDISPDQAMSHVLGYTCANDVSARDAQFSDQQWVRGKSFDTFCPLGPEIVTREEIADVQNLRVACRVNGETLQDGTTSDMVFGVVELVSYISRFSTLHVGDVILTGTPFGVGFARTPPRFLADGDVVEVEVEDVGVLRNPVTVKGVGGGSSAS